MRRFFALITSSLLLISCLPEVSIISIKSTKEIFKSYEIDHPQSISIGDPIIDIQSVYTSDAYEVLFDYQPPTKGITSDTRPFLHKGERLAVVGIEEGNLSSIFLHNDIMLININVDGTINNGWVYQHGPIAVQGEWTKERLFKKSLVPIKQVDNSFRAQILYSGLSGNTIKTVYREFVEDLARPAFSQELQYNLDESKIISYKSVRIEILKATNTQIDFKVIGDGDLPWIKE